MAKLILGCGYLGQVVANHWLAADDHVVAVTRSAEKAARMARAGIEPLVADLNQSLVLPRRGGWETVLFSVGFDRTPGLTIEDVYLRGLQTAVNALNGEVGQLDYIRSTGVYGHTDGELVDETAPCLPTRAGGKACLAAESWLVQQPVGERTTRLRLAGLYGPGRIPKLAAVVAGERLAGGGSLLNLIHRDDAAAVISAVEQQRLFPQLINVADGCPVRRSAFYAELARLVAAPEVRFDANLEPSRGIANKRIDTARLRRSVAVALQFPTYREGLQHSVEKSSQDPA